MHQLSNWNEVPVRIETGHPGDEQESSFMNGTLQTVGHNIAMTVQTFIKVPHIVHTLGENAVLAYVHNMLTKVHETHPEMTFDVQIGQDNIESDPRD